MFDRATLLEIAPSLGTAARIAIALDNFFVRYISGPLVMFLTDNPIVSLLVIWVNGGFRVIEQGQLNVKITAGHMMVWLLAAVGFHSIGIATLGSDISGRHSVWIVSLWAGSVAYSLCLLHLYRVQQYLVLIGRSSIHGGWLLVLCFAFALSFSPAAALVPLVLFVRVAFFETRVQPS